MDWNRTRFRVYDDDDAECAEIKGEGGRRISVDKCVALEDNKTGSHK